MAFALSTPQLSMLPCGKPPLQVKLVGVLCKQLICSTAVLAYIRCLALMGELVATGISPQPNMGTGIAEGRLPELKKAAPHQAQVHFLCLQIHSKCSPTMHKHVLTMQCEWHRHLHLP